MSTLLLEHFAAVSKIAAVRQSRERQHGVNCPEGYLRSTNAGLLFDGPRTLEVFFNYQRNAAYQRPAGFTADTIEFEIPASNDTLVFYCGRGRVQASLVDGWNYHAVISYNGDTAIAYLNGVVVGTITPVNYLAPALFNIGSNIYPPKGPIYFSRVYNYALFPEDVAAHYNNGDPAGYIISDAYKAIGNNYQSDFSSSSENWEPVEGSQITYNSTDKTIDLSPGSNNRARMRAVLPRDTEHRHVYLVEVETDSNSPTASLEFFPYTANNSVWLTPTTKGSTTYWEGIFIPSREIILGIHSYCYFYNVAETVHIRSIRVKSVGCVAEYLPQNLVANNNGLVSSWLDSAKQLPLNDEYLPPLLETAGGYDLAANGTPEIVYKPE